MTETKHNLWCGDKVYLGVKPANKDVPLIEAISEEKFLEIECDQTRAEITADKVYINTDKVISIESDKVQNDD